MMIDVKIGGNERHTNRPEGIEESWVTQQLTYRHAEGSVCVIVRIETPSVKVELTTPSCPPGGGERRGLREDEQRAFDLW